MGKVNQYGLIIVIMRVSSNLIKVGGKGKQFTMMEIFMKDNGKMIWQMDKEYTMLITVCNIMVNGLMIKCKAMELKSGLNMANMMDYINKAKKKEMELLLFKIIQNILVIL